MVKRLTSLFIAICLTGSLLLPVYAEGISETLINTQSENDIQNEMETGETALSDEIGQNEKQEVYVAQETKSVQNRVASQDIPKLFSSTDVQNPIENYSEIKIAREHNSLVTYGNVEALIDSNADLYMWGVSEDTGQLGLGYKELAKAPTKVMSNVAYVTVNAAVSAAITEDGDLYIWGTLGYDDPIRTPQKVLSDVSKVRLGVDQIAAVKENGDLYVWYTSYSGDGTENFCSKPYKVMGNIKDVVVNKQSQSINTDSFIALTVDGSVYGWGKNRYGELGIGDKQERLVPEKIASNVKSIGAGPSCFGFILQNGDLYVSGDNIECGLPNVTDDVLLPTKILSNVATFQLEYSNGAALSNDGKLYIWGYNTFGQCATVTDKTPCSPQCVLSNVIDFSLEVLMGRSILAITGNNKLYSWGYNWDGQTGTGGRQNNVKAPQEILEDVVFVSAGSQFGAAVTSTGKLYTWGDNSWAHCGNGECGNGADLYVLSPAAVFDGMRIQLRVSNSQTRIDVDESKYTETTVLKHFRIYADSGSNNVPNGFTVKVGSDTFESGATINHIADDIDAFVPKDYTDYVTVSKNGFYNCEIPAAYVGNFNAVVMYPTTIDHPLVQMLLLSDPSNQYDYENLICKKSGDHIVYETSLQESNENKLVDLYPDVNWNGHGEGEIFLQQSDDGIRITLENRVENSIRWSDCGFVANEPVYIVAKAADGTTEKVETTVRVIDNQANNIGLSMGDEVVVDMSQSNNENMELFNEASFKLNFDDLKDGKIPISFEVKSDGTVEGIIGYTVLERKDKKAAIANLKEKMKALFAIGETLDYSKEISDLLTDMKRYGNPTLSSVEAGVTGKGQVLGYFTGKIRTGKNTTDSFLQLTEVKIGLAFESKITYVSGFTFVVAGVPIPGYLKSQFSDKFSYACEATWDNQKGILVVDRDSQPIGLDMSVGEEVAAGWEGFSSLGIRGKGTFKVKAAIPFNKNDSEWTLSADIKAFGQLAGVSGEWKLCSVLDETVFWRNGDFVWEKADSPQSLDFTPSLQMASMRMVATGNTLAAGVNGYVAPALSKMPDGRLLAAWQADVAGRKAVDKSGIYYSICTDGTWSDAVLVCDDGTNSFAPWIYTDGTDIAIIWQHYQTKFDTDDLPDYDTLSQQIQTVGAIYDAESGIWNTPVELDEAWKYPTVTLPEDYDEENLPATSGTRQVLNNGATRVILYTAQDENEAEQVYGLFDDGYGWGKAVQLTDVAAGVNGFNAILNDSKLQILYTSGDYANSELMLYTAEMKTDLEVDSVSYVQQTFTGNNDLSLMVTVKNTGAITSNGVHVRVLNGSQELHSEDIGLRFLPGDTDTMYANCPMPEQIPYEQLTVEVTPLDTVDADLTNNTGVCVLKRTDISIEHFEAGYVYGNTEMLLQVVNRGQVATAATTAHIHKETADGEEIGTIEVPALSVGEAVYLQAEITTADPDDMLYVEIPEMEDENLIGNNSDQAIVLTQENQELPDETLVVGSILTSDAPKVRLYPENTSDADITADMKKDPSVIAVSANIQVTESDASNTSKVYNYTISDIQPGTYKLAVSCGNQTGKIETITIGDRVQLHDIQLYALGDVNNDGRVNVVDAYLIRCHAAQLKTLDGTQQLAADVNRDGRINVVDAYLVRCYAAQLIKEFPAA